MGIKDLIVTPIFLLLFTLLAYLIRPYLTNREDRKYFFSALWVRFAGAIVLGMIYEFYYGFGGDTMNFFRQGSMLYEVFFDQPSGV